MPATRIIIDMQPEFSAANKPDVVVGVTREIIQAIREKAYILIVEYLGSGVTHKGLMSLVRGYSRAFKVYKRNNDGGEEVVATLKRKKIPHKHLRVCGVNTNACVEATVRGMTRSETLQKSRIELVKNACGASIEPYNWKYFHKHPNVKLVS